MILGKSKSISGVWIDMKSESFDTAIDVNVNIIIATISYENYFKTA